MENCHDRHRSRGHPGPAPALPIGPRLARHAQAGGGACRRRSRAFAGQLDVPDEPTSDAEAAQEFRAFARARSLLRWQRRLFGLAVGLTVLSLSTAMHIDEHGISNVRLLAVEAPLAFAPLIAGAIAAWIGYFVFKRRVRNG